MAAMELWFLAELLFFSLLPSPLFLEMAEIIKPPPLHPHTLTYAHSSFSSSSSSSPSSSLLLCFDQKSQRLQRFSLSDTGCLDAELNTDKAIFAVWLHPERTETHAHAAVTWSEMTQRRPHLAVVHFTLTMPCWRSLTAAVNLRRCSHSRQSAACYPEEVTESDRGRFQSIIASPKHLIHTELLQGDPSSVLNQDCIRWGDNLKEHNILIIYIRYTGYFQNHHF